MPSGLVSGSLYCLILALRGGLCWREGVLFSEPDVAFVAAAVRGELGMVG
jgi:hypothetical protein